MTEQGLKEQLEQMKQEREQAAKNRAKEALGHAGLEGQSEADLEALKKQMKEYWKKQQDDKDKFKGKLDDILQYPGAEAKQSGSSGSKQGKVLSGVVDGSSVQKLPYYSGKDKSEIQKGPYRPGQDTAEMQTLPQLISEGKNKPKLADGINKKLDEVLDKKQLNKKADAAKDGLASSGDKVAPGVGQPKKVPDALKQIVHAVKSAVKGGLSYETE